MCRFPSKGLFRSNEQFCFVLLLLVSCLFVCFCFLLLLLLLLLLCARARARARARACVCVCVVCVCVCVCLSFFLSFFLSFSLHKATNFNDLLVCSVGILGRCRVQKISTLFCHVLALICNHYFVCSDFLPVFFFWCFFFLFVMSFVSCCFLNQLCWVCRVPFYIPFVYKVI